MSQQTTTIVPLSEGSTPVLDFLQQANAHGLAHAHGKALLDHLVGTGDILRRWLQPRWLQDAGMLHSIYATDVYKRQLVAVSQREKVQRVAGTAAERLAYLFCVLSRKHFFEQLARIDGRVRHGMVVQRHTADTSGTESLTDAEASHLLILYMANEAEQVQTPLGEPADWVARVSWMGTKLNPSIVLPPPPFHGCTVTVSRQSEAAARQAYAAAFSAGNRDEARRSLAMAHEHCPWVAEPQILAAHLALTAGEPGEVRRWLRDAKRTLAELGTAWDKRLSYDEWFSLVTHLETIAYLRPEAGTGLSAVDLQEPRQLLETLAQSESAVTVSAPVDEGLPPRFVRYLRSFGDNQRDKRMRVYPGLRSQPWYDATEFGLARALESNFTAIRREFLSVDPGAFHAESENIGRTGSWDVFLLYERGLKKRDNCALFPVTTQLIESHGTVRTLAGLIYLSRMQPHTHIAPHRGPTNMRLRLHLGILVPEGDCAIRVGTETHGWQEGKCLVFDDYFDHEAWNATPNDRVVLIVDLWHTDLSSTEVRLLEGLQGYAFANARDLSQYWARNARAGHQSN